MKYLSTIIIFLICFSFRAHADEPWTQKTDFGGEGRLNGVGFSIGDKGYAGTGYEDSLRNDFWEYDPASDAWTQLADFEGDPRSGAVGFSIGDKGFVGTGLVSVDGFAVDTTDFWEYDPQENSWTRRADFGGIGRNGAVGFSINGKGYIGTGQDLNEFQSLSDFWEYDPTDDSWTEVAEFEGDPRSGAADFSIDGRGFVGTGAVQGIMQRDFWAYDPQEDTWTQVSSIGGTLRTSAVSFSIEDKGYVSTGIPRSSRGSKLWKYDPVEDIWIHADDFPGTDRDQAFGFAVGGKGYIGTGNGSPDGTLTSLSDFWAYNPEAQQAATSVSEAAGDIPSGIELLQNHPNPFNPSTVIQYSIQRAGHVRITVHDLLGQKVKVLVDEHQNKGNHQTTLDASHLSSGSYIYRLRSGGYFKTRQMMLVK